VRLDPQRQSPSLHLPQGPPKLPETNSLLDKNWGQRQPARTQQTVLQPPTLDYSRFAGYTAPRVHVDGGRIRVSMAPDELLAKAG
jgi:hypothetical protein